MSDNYNKELIKDPLFRDIICSSKNCFMHLDYEFATNKELWTSKMVRTQSRFPVQSQDRPNWYLYTIHFGEIKKRNLLFLVEKWPSSKENQQANQSCQWMHENQRCLIGWISEKGESENATSNWSDVIIYRILYNKGQLKFL